MPFTESLLPEFDEEMKNTRKMLEAVPDGSFDYQPHSKSMTLGQLASHVAEMPRWALITVEHEVFEMQPGTKSWKATTRAELLDRFDTHVPEARAKIAAMGDDGWAKTWSFKYAGKTMLEGLRREIVRSTVMSHMIHHRAQLGVYLRMNDVAIPGMYGPSADDAKTW